MTSIKTELALPPTTEMSEYRTQILAVQQSANELRIESDTDLGNADKLLSMIADGEKLITSRKEDITRPLMKALASGRDLFRPLELGFAEAKKVIKSKMLAYQVEREQQILEDQAKIEAKVAKGRMKPETAATKMEKMNAPKLNTRVLTKVRVVDETIIPREWLIPDMTRITEAVLREGVTISGVEKYEEKILAVR